MSGVVKPTTTRNVSEGRPVDATVAMGRAPTTTWTGDKRRPAFSNRHRSIDWINQGWGNPR